jgi:hypothetical protein
VGRLERRRATNTNGQGQKPCAATATIADHHRRSLDAAGDEPLFTRQGGRLARFLINASHRSYGTKQHWIASNEFLLPVDVTSPPDFIFGVLAAALSLKLPHQRQYLPAIRLDVILVMQKGRQNQIDA